ncbi:hypothetical protein FMUND_9604 [Fusarium mundagurra]|uniref:Uncharacterized protein n=1 Tax=Fusarium mundagurra TaxID=1567541 RepID=A0A8H5YDS7_9HYPO|nr:hypothetical protein FMUND_9604 [Fusarium mundagurra]
MSSFTPINAQPRESYWSVVMGSSEERCKHCDMAYSLGCRCDDEMKLKKEEEAAEKAEIEAIKAGTEAIIKERKAVRKKRKAIVKENEAMAKKKATVKEETEAAAQSDHEAPARAAPKRPVVQERASVKKANAKRVGSSSKVNNSMPCSRCNGKEYNKSNIRDHNKVHFLEDEGVQAVFPCKCCKTTSKCIVARYPERIETYACQSCLRSHKQCSFNGLKATRYEPCKPGEHPALLRRI